MQSWTLFLLRNRAAVLLVAAALLGGGLMAWRALPIDAFPDVTHVQVMILSDAPGLTPEDVEIQVTYPIEQRMGGTPRVQSIRSLSRSGLSQVVAVFEDGTDVYWARQVIFERLAQVRDQLPEGVEPELGPISTGLGEIFQYTLESEAHGPMELRAFQDWILAPRLRTLPGINEVNSFGGQVRQVQIVVQPERLLEYRLALADVVAAVAEDNANAPGSFIVRGWEQAYVRSVGLFARPEELGALVLTAVDGRPVRLGDVAEITIGPEPRQGAVTRDGKGEVVAGMAIMLRGANSQEVVERVKAALPGIERSLPDGVRIRTFYDRSELVEAVLGTVQSALLQGAVFVILVLLLLLGEPRTALVVILAIPLTFAGAFLLMGWHGLTLNLMSVGGLIFAVGLLVDASIVVGENVLRHLDGRAAEESRAGTIARALSEVGSPVFFSVLIIVAVLAPVLTLEAMEGKMFAPLVVTMMLALLASIAVALTVVPVLASVLLRGTTPRENRLLRAVRNAQRRLLELALARPRRVAVLALLLLATAALLGTRVGTEFMPPLDEGAMALNVVRLPTAALDGSVAVGTYIEQRLARFPEVRTVVSKTGRAEISEDPMGPEQTDILVMLRARSPWRLDRSRAELEQAVREELAAIPGLRVAFSQPIALRVNELISGVKSDLAVKVFGNDLAELKDVGDRVAAALNEVAGAVDVKVEQAAGLSQIEVKIDRAAAARYGINAREVNEVIRTAVGGTRATSLVEEERRTAVVVRFPEEARASPEAIGRILVSSPGGARVPLATIATIEEVEGPAQIGRESMRRRVLVEANVRGRDLGGFVEEARARLAPLERELPPGYFLDFGGQFENQERAMRRLGFVIPLALGVIVVLLFLALRRLGDVLVVVAVLPFAVAGGVVTMAVSGTSLSVSSAVAFIILLGIAVENAVVLVSFFGELAAKGMTPAAAVRAGCELRLRPLLLTAATTFLGALPMAYALGPGAEVQRPVALILLGGLVTSLAVTLVLLPVLYVWGAQLTRDPSPGFWRSVTASLRRLI